MSGASAAGAALGLLAGCALLLVGSALVAPRTRGARRRQGRVMALLRSAGFPHARPSALVAACAGSALAGSVFALVLSGLPVAALLAATAAGIVPVLVLRRRAARRRRSLRLAWPDAVDALASAVRAGLSLPEALTDLGRLGPEALRPAFRTFADHHRSTGSFPAALDEVQRALADPVADRVVAALRLAREFGGPDLGVVLRTLSAMLRDDARNRGEIEARQSWTVAAARMAVAAPWLTLALLCTRPEAAAAFASSGGAVVIVVSAALSALAYAVMVRIGRLPSDERIAA